jgi:hypothetical protein
MPLDEGIEEVVSILTSYYQDGGHFIVEQYGEQAPMLAGEMGEVLGEFLQNETPFSQLWLEYIENPVANEAEIIGALEVLEESVPTLTIQLEGYYAGFVEMQKSNTDIGEHSEPEPLVNIEELDHVKSMDDMDNDDEYREDNTYLVGNVEDRSTSAMYYEGLDTSVEPNESEDDDLPG